MFGVCFDFKNIICRRFHRFVMSDFESVVEVSADGVGFDEVDKEEIEDF